MDESKPTISAYSDDGIHAQCMRCAQHLDPDDVAMFIRTKPADCFSAWCPKCTRWVMTLAAKALDVEDDLGVVILF